MAFLSLGPRPLRIGPLFGPAHAATCSPMLAAWGRGAARAEAPARRGARQLLPYRCPIAARIEHRCAPSDARTPSRAYQPPRRWLKWTCDM